MDFYGNVIFIVIENVGNILNRHVFHIAQSDHFSVSIFQLVERFERVSVVDQGFHGPGRVTARVEPLFLKVIQFLIL